MSAHPMRPEVTIEGRRVTVSFDMPFMAGDECVTPRHYRKTTVNMGPDVSIRLHTNLSAIDIHANGSWYTADHTQMHGTDEFLPDMSAFLDYWLKEKREYFEDRLGDLRRVFADQPEALKRLHARQVELLRAEVIEIKSSLGNTMVAATQKVIELEAAISRAKGAA